MNKEQLSIKIKKNEEAMKAHAKTFLKLYEEKLTLMEAYKNAEE